MNSTRQDLENPLVRSQENLLPDFTININPLRTTDAAFYILAAFIHLPPGALFYCVAEGAKLPSGLNETAGPVAGLINWLLHMGFSGSVLEAMRDTAHQAKYLWHSSHKSTPYEWLLLLIKPSIASMLSYYASQPYISVRFIMHEECPWSEEPWITPSFYPGFMILNFEASLRVTELFFEPIRAYLQALTSIFGITDETAILGGLHYLWGKKEREKQLDLSLENIEYVVNSIINEYFATNQHRTNRADLLNYTDIAKNNKLTIPDENDRQNLLNNYFLLYQEHKKSIEKAHEWLPSKKQSSRMLAFLAFCFFCPWTTFFPNFVTTVKDTSFDLPTRFISFLISTMICYIIAPGVPNCILSIWPGEKRKYAAPYYQFIKNALPYIYTLLGIGSILTFLSAGPTVAAAQQSGMLKNANTAVLWADQTWNIFGTAFFNWFGTYYCILKLTNNVLLSMRNEHAITSMLLTETMRALRHLPTEQRIAILKELLKDYDNGLRGSAYSMTNLIFLNDSPRTPSVSEQSSRGSSLLLPETFDDNVENSSENSRSIDELSGYTPKNWHQSIGDIIASAAQFAGFLFLLFYMEEVSRATKGDFYGFSFMTNLICKRIANPQASWHETLTAAALPVLIGGFVIDFFLLAYLGTAFTTGNWNPHYEGENRLAPGNTAFIFGAVSTMFSIPYFSELSESPPQP